jgi:hypothetical protein
MAKKGGQSPMTRIVLGVALALVIGLAAIGGYAVVTDGAAAQGSGPWWQTAGGAEGFAIAEWGTGNGPGVSLDDWIESMPATCDIQLVERDAGFRSVMYRCPD